MFFYNESKILTILFIVRYDKITLFDEFLAFLGPIISRLFTCSKEEKNKQKQQRVLALVLSLWGDPLVPTVGVKTARWRQSSDPAMAVSSPALTVYNES